MPQRRRADLVSAWALGVGVGLMALQVTWLVANRIASLIWEAPVGPTVAFATAVVTGMIVSAIAGKRLAAKVLSESVPVVGLGTASSPTADRDT